MEKIIDLLNRKLNGISICSETINFETTGIIAESRSVEFDNVIKNSQNNIVAVFSTLAENKNLEELLKKIKDGFNIPFFYEDSNNNLLFKKPNSNFQKTTLIDVIHYLKQNDPSLKTDYDLEIEGLREKLDSLEKDLLNLTKEKIEIEEKFEWNVKDLDKTISNQKEIIRKFESSEKERIQSKLNKIKERDLLINTAFSFYNPIMEPQYVEKRYGRDSSDVYSVSTSRLNSKVLRYLSFYKNSWMLRVEIYDWYDDLQSDMLGGIKNFKYSSRTKQFTPADKELIKEIPFWMQF
jgi:hypothetical protein